MGGLAVPLAEAQDESSYGGKAVSLGAAVRAGLPVPPGIAIGAALVNAAVAGDPAAVQAVLGSTHLPSGRLAVRSSAVGEDSPGASFAGQHATKLNVRSGQLLDAVRVVWESGRSQAALAYRERKGLPRDPRIGVVVQMLVEPAAAGVLFTRDPITGADEHVIEAAWGLGEAVVNGAVVPDRIRLAPDGRVLEYAEGDKDIKVWYGDDDGTIEMAVDAALRCAPCLTARQIAELHELSERCIRVWGPHLDIEWALGGDGNMYLLQCRPITALPARP
jgi:pyruvate,water dikinase